MSAPRWNHRVRQTHRWMSILFVATVIANFVALARSGGALPPPWITYAPLPPLALLSLSGLYLFALPYVARMSDPPAAARDR